MKDSECVPFLQWALPQMGKRWPGYRRVRGQVCKRLGRRLDDLQLDTLKEYREYLAGNPGEWPVLDDLCRVTISRFYRDKQIFDLLKDKILPEQAQQAVAGGKSRLRMWSAGCASGEEAYTLSLTWSFSLKKRFPGITPDILATDSSASLLDRARKGCYPCSSLKDLPDTWLKNAFKRANEEYYLRREYRQPVEFQRHDIRGSPPAGPFHLILCRNLVFTYFAETAQRDFLRKAGSILIDNGILVIGQHESLPEGRGGFEKLPGSSIYGKTKDGGS